MLYTDGDGAEQALPIGAIAGDGRRVDAGYPAADRANTSEMTVAFRFTASAPAAVADRRRVRRSVPQGPRGLASDAQPRPRAAAMSARSAASTSGSAQ